MAGVTAQQRTPLQIKSLADLKRRIEVGTELVATFHKKHPDLVGLTRVVTQVHTNCFYSKIKDQPDHRWSACNGGTGFRSDYGKASAYRFDGSKIRVLDMRAKDGSVLYEMEVYPREMKLSDQKEEPMNEWDRLRRQAQRYKQEYPVGTRIQLLHMGNDPRPVEDNMRGTVVAVDDIGTIHCKFDNGRQLGIVPGEDSFRALTEAELMQEKNAGLLARFRGETARLSNVHDLDSLYTSPDFQCDQTGGYPTSLVVNWNENKAWLELNDSLAAAGDDLTPYELACAEWGIRTCWDIEDYNAMVMSLGEDAMDNATIYADADEGIVMQ